MTDNMIALSRRVVACKGWRWMRGMNTTTGDTFIAFSDCDEAYWQGESSSRTSDSFAGVIPDLTDPATLGCLLALVREAWGEPRTVVVPLSGGKWGVAIPNVLRQSPTHKGDTEAEALVAALEAAP